MTKRIYDMEEAAHYLGRTVPALRALKSAGKIPYMKDGRRVLFDLKDLDAYIEGKIVYPEY